MARTGTFGRLPRAAPSLEATLVAIAREMEQQRDQNMMDAWQKGGSVDGKKVTDEAILAYWNKRLQGVSKDDPLYDTYANAIKQYQYAIAESKMTAQYALIPNPTAGDDSRMAQFYLNWAKKVPRDSEFYRVLQRDAGQFIRSARAKGEASNRSALEARYQAQLGAIEHNKMHAGELGLQYVTMLLQRGSQGQGAVLGEQPLGNEHNIASTTNLAALELPSIDEVMSLLASVNVADPISKRVGERVAGPGNPAVLFHDEAGNPITGTQIIAALKDADPSFNGIFDVSSLNRMIANQKEGIQQQMALAKKTGHISDMMQLQAQLARVNEYGNELAAWPVMQSYSDLKQQLDDVMRDDSLLPAAKVAAIDRLRGQIGALANDPRIANDDHLRSQLQGEAEGAAGTVTVSEDMEGLQNGYTNQQSAQNSEVLNINQQRDLLQQQIDLTADPNSGYVMTQGDYLSDGQGGITFKPSPGGKAVGAASLADIQNMPGAAPPVTVMVPNGDGGGATPMMLVPAPVTATAKKADGTTIGFSNKNPVATFIQYSVNGQTVTVYGLKDAASGQVRWTTDPPWDTSKVKATTTNGGIVLDLSAVVPQQDTTGATGGAIAGAPGFSVAGKSPASRGGKGSAGQLVMDPAAAALGTEPARQAAGPDPYTDSFSPTLVALRNTPDGPMILQQIADTPAFRQVIDSDAHRAAGMTYDPAANNGAGGWTGNPTQTTDYQKYAAQGKVELNFAAQGRSAGDPLNVENRDAWWRDTTATQTTGAPATPVNPDANKLPIDVIRQTGMGNWNTLAAAFQAGTNNFLPPTADTATPSLKAGVSLTIPAIQPSSILPAPQTYLPGKVADDLIPAPAPAPMPTSYNPVPSPYTNPAPSQTNPKAF